MQAVQAMTGHGGWPMTVFLTPDGKPFYGGTYFPPEDRHGHAGLPRVCCSASPSAWHDAAGEVVRVRRGSSAESLGQTERPARRSRDAPDRRDPVRRLPGASPRSSTTSDGGFGGAPKFPQPMIWEFLLRCDKRDRNARRPARWSQHHARPDGPRRHVRPARRRLPRYSVDAHWLVPHFEKMLYDNAQLASLYLHA